jgi:hypothetical protein
MIAAELLVDVMRQVVPPLAFDDLARRLRAAFPGMHITVCGEDDIPPRLPAAAENEHCFLYYVDANEHCLKLTTDPDVATGLAVALRADDE